jgi:cell division protein FtsW
MYKEAHRHLTSPLLLAAMTLLGVGLVEVYSASYVYATENFGDGLFFFRRQAIFSVLALIILIGSTYLPFNFIKKYSWILWLVASFAVIATFLPGVGVRVGGALRWIDLPGGVRFEPSELLKISLGFLAATLYVHRKYWLSGKRIFLALGVAFLPVLALLKQPDFGSFAIITAVAMALLIAYGLRWRFVFGFLAVLIPAFYFLVMRVDYRRARIAAFLDPWADPAQKGFQVIQSMLSVSSGGLTGVGLGKGQGKLFFLPEAHTDFTLAVFAEEAGFIGVTLLMALYVVILVGGFRIAYKAKDDFRRILALSLTMVFALSVGINFGVVLGLLPTKGLTLPFMSHGGSSLIVFALLVGVLINIEKMEKT